MIAACPQRIWPQGSTGSATMPPCGFRIPSEQVNLRSLTLRALKIRLEKASVFLRLENRQ